MSFDFDRIVYFGDSLTETGAIFAVTSGALITPFPLQSAGYAMQFSNGPVYSDVAPDLLGVAADNFAVGSGRAVGSRTLLEFLQDNDATFLIADPEAPELGFDFNLGAQIARFATAEAAAPGAAPFAASFFIGINDYGDFAPTSPETAQAEGAALLAEVVGATLGAAGAAIDAGADAVILNTLPDPAVFPASQFADPGLVALGGPLIDAHNLALRAGGALLEAATGVEVEVVDLGAMFEEIAADPAAFGFLAPVDQPFLLGAAADPVLLPNGELGFPRNPAVAGFALDEIAFYDFLHPTAAMHGVLGVFSAGALSMETDVLGEGGNLFFGGGEANLVLARGGGDIVATGGGADTALGGLGDDRLFLGDGDDIAIAGSGDDLIVAGAGDDVAAGGAGDDYILAGAGNDVVIDGLGADRALGGGGDDAFFYIDPSLIGGATGADRDLFVGGGGTDTLYLALGDATRTVVAADIGGGLGFFETVDVLGLTTVGIEEVVFVDERADLAQIAADARLAEADLWGLV